MGDVFVGDTEGHDDSDAQFVPGTAWDAWMLQAVKSVVRARVVARVMRVLAVVAAVVALIGVAATYWAFLASDFGPFNLDTGGAIHADKVAAFRSATALSAGIGLGAFTSIALLLGGSVLVDLHAQRLDLAIIEADDEGDIE